MFNKQQTIMFLLSNGCCHCCNNMTENSLLLQFTGDSPIFKIIDFLFENKEFDFSKKDIIGGAGILRAALFKCWSEIEACGLVRVARKFGKTHLYRINSENPLVKNVSTLNWNS